MATTTATRGGLWDRAIRAARLDRATYEEVEADTTATMQAAIVVVVGAIAAGIGTGVAFGGGAFGQILVDSIGALIAWAVYAYVAFFVGTKLLAGPETHADWGQVARTLGFAAAPRTLLILGVIPGLVGLVGIGVAIWLLVTTVVALRAALDVTTGRAIGIAVVSWLSLALVQVLIAAVI